MIVDLSLSGRKCPDDERHKLPHIHAKYQGQEAYFSIFDGAILSGEIPVANMACPYLNRGVFTLISVVQKSLLYSMRYIGIFYAKAKIMLIKIQWLTKK